MKMKKARLALYITLACLLVASVLGTAYAKYTSIPLTDTFNVYVTAGEISDLGISGDQSDLLVIPGTYLKLQDNPTVSLDKSSENCFVFLKIEKTTNVASIMTVIPDSSWTQLGDGVYYLESTADHNVDLLEKREHKVFSDAALTQSIWVSPSATKAQVQAITSGDKITFTAYAVQKTPGMDAATAWTKLNQYNG